MYCCSGWFSAPLERSSLESRNEAFCALGKTGRTSDRYFQERILWAQYLYLLESFYFFKSLQSCLTLCDPTDGSPPGSPVPGILQARTLEWVAIFLTPGKVLLDTNSLQVNNHIGKYPKERKRAFSANTLGPFQSSLKNSTNSRRVQEGWP